MKMTQRQRKDWSDFMIGDVSGKKSLLPVLAD
jgi:hypothetical protein